MLSLSEASQPLRAHVGVSLVGEMLRLRLRLRGRQMSMTGGRNCCLITKNFLQTQLLNRTVFSQLLEVEPVFGADD